MTRDETIELMNEVIRRCPEMAYATQEEWRNLAHLILAEIELGPEPAA